MTSTDDTRARVLALVQRHGWNATSFQTLESGYSYFFHGSDACVAYVDTGRAWVVAGAPLAPEEALGGVVSAFVSAARAAGRRCCFFATEDRLQNAAGGALRSLRIGEQPVWDPADWPSILEQRRSLREQLRRARARGLRVRQASPAELQQGDTREALRLIIARWLATRGLPPMQFLLAVEPFHLPSDRRCFVAEAADGRVVAFAGVVPVPARAGWLLEDLIRDPDAPNGTAELLVDAVMRAAAASGVRWLTLGLAPLAGRVTGLLRLARRGTRVLYDFEGLRAYKAKLSPRAWIPIHLAFPPTQGPALSVLDALAGFARGGLSRFGLRSLLRGPPALLRLLALLLVPWAGLLALAPADRCCHGSPVKWAWVVFDVVVAAGLLRLAQRPTRRLATALAVAVTGDAVLTAVQAAAWTLGQARGLVEHLVVLLACAAPAFAAVVLWGARLGRLRRR